MDIQELLPEGTTITPIILSSDKTHLTWFSGDKAWPVYITIGNIGKEVCRKSSAHETVLLGYIPVCKLECFTKKHHSAQSYQLFHDCMKTILLPWQQLANLVLTWCVQTDLFTWSILSWPPILQTTQSSVWWFAAKKTTITPKVEATIEFIPFFEIPTRCWR